MDSASRRESRDEYEDFQNSGHPLFCHTRRVSGKETANGDRARRYVLASCEKRRERERAACEVCCEVTDKNTQAEQRTPAVHRGALPKARFPPGVPKNTATREALPRFLMQSENGGNRGTSMKIFKTADSR